MTEIPNKNEEINAIEAILNFAKMLPLTPRQKFVLTDTRINLEKIFVKK